MQKFLTIIAITIMVFSLCSCDRNERTEKINIENPTKFYKHKTRYNSDKNSESLPLVTYKFSTREGSGTCFRVGAYTVTALHCLGDDHKFYVEVDGIRKRVKLLHKFENEDIAILEAAEGMVGLPVGELKDQMLIQTQCMTDSYSGHTWELFYLKGKIVEKTYMHLELKCDKRVQFEIPFIMKGFSGSPVMDSNGVVIGVLTNCLPETLIGTMPNRWSQGLFKELYPIIQKLDNQAKILYKECDGKFCGVVESL